MPLDYPFEPPLAVRAPRRDEGDRDEGVRANRGLERGGGQLEDGISVRG